MKTEVKIYREAETELMILDEQSEQRYHQLMDELGIEKPKPDSVKPPVYAPINATMFQTLKVLCPCETEWDKYNRSTIPVEVLEIIDYCKKNKIFDKMIILSDDKDPDPMLIGKTYRTESDRSNEYSWNMNTFLVARWGDCSYELLKLIEMGRDKIKNQLLEGFANIAGLKATFDIMPDALINKSLEERRNVVTREYLG